MKDTFLQSFRIATKERRLLSALAVFAVVTLVFIIYVSVNIHPSELKIVTHYSAFGSTNFYRDTWYYLVNFVLFGVVLLVGHTLIALKLLVTKGRELAVAFVWLSVIIIFVAFATVYQVLRVAALA